MLKRVDPIGLGPAHFWLANKQVNGLAG